MKIIQLKLGPMANFSYLACGPEGCLIVDPSWEPEKLRAAAAAEGAAIKALLLTHGHFDHSRKIAELAADAAEAYVEESDLPMLEADRRLFTTFRGDCSLSAAGFEIRVIHTPGHSPGSVCYLAEGNLFTGDTLFVDEVGRVDLPGSSPEAMYSSLLKIAQLPPETIIHPGHAYGSQNSATVGAQLLSNPYLKLAAARNKADFLAAMR
ncbi:MAG: MBL fold metallo-hydrolase [Elusimicrobiales bacterium]|nr:MBL fold metallo-hydrolase [Elusimicrobiales bacterium]